MTYSEESLIKKIYTVYVIPIFILGVFGYIAFLFLSSAFITFEHVSYRELVPEEKAKKFLVYTNVMMAESWITFIPYAFMIVLLMS